jgi:hypothetical protein
MRSGLSIVRRVNERTATMDGKLAQRLMWITWPAFLVACVAELVFFSVFDPFGLHYFGEPLEWSRQAVYALGFFGFWGLGMASSALTVFLGRSPFEVNRCPLDAPARPPGCPKRECDEVGRPHDVGAPA